MYPKSAGSLRKSGRIMARIGTLFLWITLAASAQNLNYYSVEREQALGASLAEDVRHNTTPFENAAAQAYVERIGARLVAALPADAPAFTYHWELILDRQSYLEPTSLPGGYHFIPSSLFLDAQNESEFAGLLAHALAHSYLRHGTRLDTRGQVASYATVPLIFVGGWPQYGIRQTATLAMPLGMLQFQRQFEQDADRAAVQMLAAAGFDPHGLADYVERMQLDPQGTAAGTFSRFPPKDERVAAIEQAIADLTPAFPAIQEGVRQALPPSPAPDKPPTLRRTPTLRRPPER